jgi:hypothetical protein
MWLDEYNELNNGERERFAKLVNYLLNKTYLTREIYEGKQVIGKINADYRFIERYITLFEGYLNVINYTLTIDEELGVVYLTNEYGYNKMHLDKLTTLVLFTLRTIYDEEKEKNATSSVVYITTASLIYKLLELKIVTKKPTMKDMVESIRLLVTQNILTKIEGNLEDSACQLAILPTILLIVSNEKIDAIYSMVFQEEKELPINLNQDVDDSVFNLGQEETANEIVEENSTN